ncbi:chemotaxis protein methyltransferase CheR [Paucimonas lemoignei]|uniref:Chemotaxis protein methyltransferase CheR n=1 Tax=Paucimonas lemoignei TaxID=29443 RepID=A0A4R3HW51_PAULE|nr:CheR family methyltransferase [Paucimonas lemoignei]TCS36325.1 chemotaxis protein methyltransferase CheR [Paucimonas lemoignei]
MVVPVNNAANDSPHDIEEVELDLLLDGMHRRYDEDFRAYERRFLRRKTFDFMRARGLETVSALQNLVLHDEAAASELCQAFVSQQSMLFDDADEFHALRGMIGPLLGSYVAPKIWIAECLCAEEVFSFAILLLEEGHYDKSLIFATCSNEAVLQEIKKGTFSLDRLAAYEENYRRSGGRRSFAEYYQIRDGRAVFLESLQSRIIWAQYSLCTDSSFNEFQLISCRKSYASFGMPLQRRIIHLFNDSLSRFGILNVAADVDIGYSPLLMNYKELGRRGIYRRAR